MGESYIKEATRGPRDRRRGLPGAKGTSVTLVQRPIVIG